MTAPKDLLALAARCEAAEAADRELDCLIENATGLAKFAREPDTLIGDSDYTRIAPKPYTASIDAALQLVPEGCWPGFQKNKGVPDHQRWGAWLDTDDFDLFRGCAHTAALALCAAALRSHQGNDNAEG